MPAAVERKLELVSVRVDLGDLDPPGGDRPELIAAPHGFRPVRRCEALLHRFGERGKRVGGHVLVHDEVAVGERHEMDLIAREAGGLRGADRVPAARAGDAVDAGHAPVRPGIDRLGLRFPLEVEAGLSRELLVDRLAPEDHWGSINP